tara:strand:- start:432 stop:671 length:240 start_codon:yes stop_codon:yes gene_type:complete
MSELQGKIHKVGDRVRKKSTRASTNAAYSSPIYGHITEIEKKSNSAKRWHHYCTIKHERTGRTSQHIEHQLVAAPLTPQ